jgi:hypothetical protein
MLREYKEVQTAGGDLHRDGGQVSQAAARQFRFSLNFRFVPRLKFCASMPIEHRLPRSEHRRLALAGESGTLELQNQPASGPVRDVGEARRKPRFKFAVDIGIHSQSCGLLKGRTLDISEIGIGAVLGEDIPLGEVVKLNIPLPSGPVTICATVRQRSSFFRYGFEFIESNSVREILQSTCRQLAVQQSASGEP